MCFGLIVRRKEFTQEFRAKNKESKTDGTSKNKEFASSNSPSKNHSIGEFF